MMEAVAVGCLLLAPKATINKPWRPLCSKGISRCQSSSGVALRVLIGLVTGDNTAHHTRQLLREGQNKALGLMICDGSCAAPRASFLVPIPLLPAPNGCRRGCLVGLALGLSCVGRARVTQYLPILFCPGLQRNQPRPLANVRASHT